MRLSLGALLVYAQGNIIASAQRCKARAAARRR